LEALVLALLRLLLLLLLECGRELSTVSGAEPKTAKPVARSRELLEVQAADVWLGAAEALESLLTLRLVRVGRLSLALRQQKSARRQTARRRLSQSRLLLLRLLRLWLGLGRGLQQWSLQLWRRRLARLSSGRLLLLAAELALAAHEGALAVG
jgi:hypothetical protein